MDSLGQKLAMMLQQQQGRQQPMQAPMPQMPMMQQMPARLDPFGQQQTGLAQALMRGIQYAQPRS